MHTSSWILRISKRFSLANLIVAIALTFPLALFGQGYFGTISGTLTDSSGAIVQGAHVTLQDEQKGYTFHATSDNAGRYLFASIPPGTYSVSAGRYRCG
jgi:hypothetical protein